MGRASRHHDVWCDGGWYSGDVSLNCFFAWIWAVNHGF
jgi:hypothetical protein